MGFWNRFCSMFSDNSDHADSQGGCDINPASGLPMIDGCGGVDIAGSPFGTDLHHDSAWCSSSTLDDTFSSSGLGSTDSFTSGSGWDDPFSGSSSDTWSD